MFFIFLPYCLLLVSCVHEPYFVKKENISAIDITKYGFLALSSVDNLRSSNNITSIGDYRFEIQNLSDHSYERIILNPESTENLAFATGGFVFRKRDIPDGSCVLYRLPIGDYLVESKENVSPRQIIPIFSNKITYIGNYMLKLDIGWKISFKVTTSNSDSCFSNFVINNEYFKKFSSTNVPITLNN